MAKIIPPKEAMRRTDIDSRIYHLWDPEKRKTFCHRVITNYSKEIVSIEDLDAKQICSQCLGYFKIID